MCLCVFAMLCVCVPRWTIALVCVGVCFFCVVLFVRMFDCWCTCLFLCLVCCVRLHACVVVFVSFMCLVVCLLAWLRVRLFVCACLFVCLSVWLFSRVARSVVYLLVFVVACLLLWFWLVGGLFVSFSVGWVVRLCVCLFDCVLSWVGWSVGCLIVNVCVCLLDVFVCLFACLCRVCLFLGYLVDWFVGVIV